MLDTLRPRRVGVALGVVTGLAWSLSKVSIGLLVKQAVDRGIEGGSGGRGDTGSLVTWAIAIGRRRASSSGVLTGVRRYLAFREARLVEKRLRDRLFAHVQRLHFAYHDEVQAGQLMSRGNTDLQQVQAFVVMIPLTIANAMTVRQRHRHPGRHRPAPRRAVARRAARSSTSSPSGSGRSCSPR